MTYDEVKTMPRRPTVPKAPWNSGPGKFMIQLIPAGQVDPQWVDAQSMTDAIWKAGEVFEHFPDGSSLRVTSNDGNEIYKGPLR